MRKAFRAVLGVMSLAMVFLFVSCSVNGTYKFDSVEFENNGEGITSFEQVKTYFEGMYKDITIEVTDSEMIIKDSGELKSTVKYSKDGDKLVVDDEMDGVEVTCKDGKLKMAMEIEGIKATIIFKK